MQKQMRLTRQTRDLLSAMQRYGRDTFTDEELLAFCAGDVDWLGNSLKQLGIARLIEMKRGRRTPTAYIQLTSAGRDYGQPDSAAEKRAKEAKREASLRRDNLRELGLE